MLVDNKGVVDGLWRGERECITPKAGDADLWMNRLAVRDVAIEVEHVKPHLTNKEKQCMSRLEKFVTEGNEKADELAKEGAMLDEGRGRNEKMCMQLCSVQPAFTALWNNGKTVKRSSNRSRKKSGFCGPEKKRRRSIERRGVQKRKSIDA